MYTMCSLSVTYSEINREHSKLICPHPVQLHISPLFAYQVIPWSSLCDHVNSPLKPTVLQQLTSDWGQNKL